MKITVTYREHECTVPVYNDDSFAAYDKDNRHYLVCNEYGPCALVVSTCSFCGAWSEYVDNCTPIEQSEIPEAYGFDIFAELEAADNGNLELEEGYEYQNNSTDTGIVWVGHYTTMYEVKLQSIVLA